MPITRRVVLAAAASLAVPQWPAPAAAEASSKAKFIEQATKEIEERAQKVDARWSVIERVCIPVPFADFDFYWTKGLLMWAPNPGQELEPVIVPEGFCTDLTSVPQLFWSIYPKTGKYAYAAIAHDYLYWMQTTTRKQADDMLYTAMQDSQVSGATVRLIHGMVRAGGGSSWSGNAAAKARGEKRFLKVFPADGKLVSWADWKKDKAHFRD